MITSFISLPLMLCTAFILPVVGIYKKQLVPAIALTSTAISFILSVLTVGEVIEKKVLVEYMSGWFAPYGIVISIDAFSIMIILTITFIGFLATLLSQKYIRNSIVEYYTLICLLMVGLLGISHTGDLFNLFIFIEITSIASYALTAYNAEKKSIEASIKYLIMGSFATSLMLLGIALLYGATGTLNMADIALKLKDTGSALASIILGLILSGLAFKIATVPVHAWKPDIIEASPVTVGALFTSASSTVFIYVTMRVLYTIFNINVDILLITAGTITMLVGALLAMQQDDILRLLAYSAVSQAGFILIAFAADTRAGIYHLFNVAIIEALLFFSIAPIIFRTKETNMQKISKPYEYHPLITAAFVIGILSNAGIPFLGGFSSKWLIYVTTLELYPLVTVAAVLTSIITLAYSLKAYYLLFRGSAKTAKIKSIDKATLFALGSLIFITIYFGIFARHGADISEGIASSLKNSAFYIKTVFGK